MYAGRAGGSDYNHRGGRRKSSMSTIGPNTLIDNISSGAAQNMYGVEYEHACIQMN